MRYLITGGAGFIGCNYADRLLSRGEKVVVFDNLSRAGSEDNLSWLWKRHNGDHDILHHDMNDVCDFPAVCNAVRTADVVVHLAAQTAVTASIEEPGRDFCTNAIGTVNVLEAARQAGHFPVVLYASTNKVYGAMDDEEVTEIATRYVYRSHSMGIAESQPLDFHSPYGCSKGAGDQYAHDYARIYGLPTVVFRQSCIYGPRQMGVEDQGWLAWFMIAAVTGQPITIYGDGKQVRDVLYIDDLLDLYDVAIARIDTVGAGQVYNVGGGPSHTISVWEELAPRLEMLLGRKVDVSFSDWRSGDQRVYISDIRKATQHFDWRPRVDVDTGIHRLYEFVKRFVKRGGV